VAVARELAVAVLVDVEVDGGVLVAVGVDLAVAVCVGAPSPGRQPRMVQRPPARKRPRRLEHACAVSAAAAHLRSPTEQQPVTGGGGGWQTLALQMPSSCSVPRCKTQAIMAPTVSAQEADGRWQQSAAAVAGRDPATMRRINNPAFILFARVCRMKPTSSAVEPK
jgi:hypothetical protein